MGRNFMISFHRTVLRSLRIQAGLIDFKFHWKLKESKMKAEDLAIKEDNGMVMVNNLMTSGIFK